MTDAEKAAFNHGYLIACCNIENLHKEGPIAADVLAEAGISSAEVKAMNLSEYDARALRSIRKARSVDPIVSK
ncbi:hypothetical protein D2T29_12695 [Sinirhodobacter populi]|uniref:Uncharacterized protein n=1 Tax=Paenirhodobacter populi TaxID=2306993 RepID=A0A443KD49_9RHOB|nr:hypothetical protein [Sinirhodobacter populi]RWR30523.1 hypothetical protein D2T29_12695 [Sinirhodobacter populi]